MYVFYVFVYVRQCVFSCVTNMDDITNSPQLRQRSMTDDANFGNLPKHKWSNVSGEIDSLRQENNPYMSVYRRVDSSPAQSSSILPSCSSSLLPANLLAVQKSPCLSSMPVTSVPVLLSDPAGVVGSHATNISRVPESIPERIPNCEDLPVFIPTCEDLIIGSEDEYDSERDDCKSVVQLVPSAIRKFLPHDAKESALVQSGGRRRSKGSENWASNTFNEWCTFRGYPISKSLVDLSELPDVKPLAAMLKDFFLECVKKDGTMYPPSS